MQNNNFIIYVLKYLGVALIAGSVVHVGTLQNGTIRYVVLGIVGLCLMILGNILESKQKNEPINIKYLGLITALSLTTGFLSGGIQHYLDNPSYAGYLLGVGTIGTYITFVLKEKSVLNAKKILLVLLVSVLIVVFSTQLMPQGISDHHGVDVKQHDVPVIEGSNSVIDAHTH